MGLTKQISGFVPENAQHYRNEENITHKQIIDKLGQLEDIEDKLGIDLITLSNEINGTKAYEIISGIADAIKRRLEH